jgi:hypothetical protein
VGATGIEEEEEEESSLIALPKYPLDPLLLWHPT